MPSYECDYFHTLPFNFKMTNKKQFKGYFKIIIFLLKIFKINTFTKGYYDKISFYTHEQEKMP